MLSGLLSSAAGAVLAEAPLSSLRPSARTAATPAAVLAPSQSPIPRVAPRVRATIQQLIAAADLYSTVGVVLADAGTGEVLEAVEGEVAVPPASVIKAVTALYALDALGGAIRFITRFFAVGSL